MKWLNNNVEPLQGYSGQSENGNPKSGISDITIYFTQNVAVIRTEQFREEGNQEVCHSEAQISNGQVH